MQNYRQNDPRWANMPYAGGLMADSGCGPTAVADIAEKDPWTVAQWMTSHGYASNGSGTYWGGIPAALRAFGIAGQQLNYSSLYGTSGTSVENRWQTAIQSGKFTGILLMGPGRFTNGGHYIAITQYSDGQYYVYDPAYAPRDGWHPWSHFSSNVKIFYLAEKTAPSDSEISVPGEWKAIGTATSTDNSVNVRSTPSDSTNHNIMGQVFAGNRFEVDGIVTDGWIHVKVSGIGTGYIYQAYVRYDGLPAPIPDTASDITTYGFTVSQIHSGDTGLSVLLLQEILKARGLYNGALDRSYGPATTASVIQYQILRNMKVDGICGPATWSDLLALPG